MQNKKGGLRGCFSFYVTCLLLLRRKYGLNEGDVLTLVDLGDGAFVLYPGITTVDRSGDRVAQVMAEENVTLEDILEALDEERERYYQER